MMAPTEHIIFFDGVCNYCNSVVQFVIRHDRAQKFSFAALQSDYGQAFLKEQQLNHQSFDTFVYQQRGKVFTKSTAALLVAKELGGFWKLFALLLVFPAFIRNPFYDLIAKNRYRIFGKMESCMVPTAAQRERFLF